MQAIQIDRYGGPDVLQPCELPEPLPAPGEILIGVAAIGVNPADLKWRAGLFADFAPVRFPHILGYDVAGVVLALGSEASGFAIGDQVAAMLDPFHQGAYAEAVLASAADVARLPADLSCEVAAALPTPGLTGVQLVEEALDVRPGQRLLITGATGAVGRFAVHAARRRDAHVIAAVRAAQRDEAQALGAAEVLVLGIEPPTGAPYDAVADTVGGEIVHPYCRHVARDGAIRTVSTTPIPDGGLPVPALFFAVHPDARRLADLARAAMAGEIAVPIARRLPLANAAEAHRLQQAGGQGGKLILIP